MKHFLKSASVFALVLAVGGAALPQGGGGSGGGGSGSDSGSGSGSGSGSAGSDGSRGSGSSSGSSSGGTVKDSKQRPTPDNIVEPPKGPKAKEKTN